MKESKALTEDTKPVNPYGLSDEAFTLIRDGVDGVGGFSKGRSTYRIALQLASKTGAITPSERKTIAETENCSKDSVDRVIRRLRELKLWDDEVGGLGRVKVEKKVESPNNSSTEVKEVKVTAQPTAPSEGASSEGLTLKNGEVKGELKPAVQHNAIKGIADELGVDSTELQVFLDAKRREKTKSEEAKIQDLVDQRLKQLFMGNPPTTGNPGNSPPPPTSDAEKLRGALTTLSPAELRQQLRQRTGGVENPMLTAFQYMESEMSIVDIMDELNLDFQSVVDYQEKFNQMKALELERQQLTEPYLKAWFDLAVTLGEDMRRNCNHYNEVSGVCEYWRLDELSETYRKTYVGLYKSAGKKKGGYYINVDRHSEVCAICSIGMMRKEGGIVS